MRDAMRSMSSRLHYVAPLVVTADEKTADASSALPYVDSTFGATTADEATADADAWLRASELPGVAHDPRLYCTVEPNDVLQGGIGDCWLMTAIASVSAVTPRRVVSLCMPSPLSLLSVVVVAVRECVYSDLTAGIDRWPSFRSSSRKI